MKCKWYIDFEGICTNGACPYYGGICPTAEHPEVCKRAEKEIRHLSAEELATALRSCYTGSECDGCPCRYYYDDAAFDEPCDVYVIRQAADMLEKLAAEKDAKKPEWISVKDRLPENTEFVLVTNADCKSVNRGFAVFRDGEWHSPIDNISYWMPLPEPPKEDER